MNPPSEAEVGRFYSEDGSRMAVIHSTPWRKESALIIDFYEENKIVDYQILEGKSLHFAESVAENFVLRVT